MLFFSKKEQIILVFLVVIVVSISLFNFLNKEKPELLDDETLVEDYINGLNELDEENSEEPSEIMVHISGQVYNPGLVILEAGSRLIDAVELAGGLKKDADLDKINLAKKLSDEEKIYIPKIGEEYIEEVYKSSNSSTTSGKININTCTKEELMSLPGIGEVLADRIMKYRSENKFQTIEDIKNVSGIGEKRFEDIKDLIIVK
ncbi:MAG: hypothetical protein GX069_08680 [Tissierellia bacterium]|nr:hypothetical protein [Tissierellia bacterium]